MNIKELRGATNMSQREFCEYFGIPLGTLRNWEQEISKPPEYVYSMILSTIRRDIMINTETLKLLRTINELTELSEKGFLPFSEATEENMYNYVLYDEKTCSGDEDYKEYRIVHDHQIDELHHDVISYYDSESFEYTIRVAEDECGFFICINLLVSDDNIIIENGRWYYSN